jgi:hypothetical protein
MTISARQAVAITGIERLRLAGVLARQCENGAAEGMLQSASEIWSAMFELPTWPTELRMKAVELQGILFRYGTIRMTIEQMVEPERLQLRRELLAFVETAERLDGAGDSHDGRALSEECGEPRVEGRPR